MSLSAPTAPEIWRALADPAARRSDPDMKTLKMLAAAVAFLATPAVIAAQAAEPVVLERGNGAEPDTLDPQKATGSWENNIIGDSLLAVGDDELIKVHYHTNEPWQVLEYCAGLGDIYDIVVENMQRQSDGLDG